MLVSAPASALAIGSWLALVPAAAFCLAILKRVAKEGKLVPMRTIGAHIKEWLKGQIIESIAYAHAEGIDAAHLIGKIVANPRAGAGFHAATRLVLTSRLLDFNFRIAPYTTAETPG